MACLLLEDDDNLLHHFQYASDMYPSTTYSMYTG